MSELLPQPPSPTGAPVLPKWLPAVASAIVGIAAVAQQALPEHTIGFKVASAVIAVGAMFGIVSQGVRR